MQLPEPVELPHVPSFPLPEQLADVVLSESVQEPPVTIPEVVSTLQNPAAFPVEMMNCLPFWQLTVVVA